MGSITRDPTGLQVRDVRLRSVTPGLTVATSLRYYFTNKFMNPVCDLLEPLIKNRDAIFGEFLSSKRKVCWDAKQPKIGDYFKKVPTSCGAT
jgi:hypothetical protein